MTDDPRSTGKRGRTDGGGGDPSRSTSRRTAADARASGRMTQANDATMAEGPPPGSSPGDGPAVKGDGQAIVGRTLGGCRVEALLGKGGMATVYKARQLDLDREVAVKVLAPKLMRDPRQVDQFAKEAKTLARLEHPNILTVYAFGREEDVCFLVCQIVRGGSLRAELEGKGKFTPEVASAYVQQIAKGLAEAHKAGVVHRDIKPDNVLVAAGPTLKIADFGLARMANDPSQFGAGLVVGTPHYMPPEQVDGQEVDARADIYALGATFYQMLTGSTPFSAPTVVDLLIKHVNAPLVPPHERAPGVPLELSRIVCKMMEKDRARRYASMDEVLADLAAPSKGSSAAKGAAPQPAPAPAPEPEPAPSLLLEDALPPPVFVRQSAPPPRAAGFAFIGLVALGAAAAGASAGPIVAVVNDAKGEVQAIEAEEDAAAAARERLDRAILGKPDADRAGALETFGKDRAGTRAGKAADEEAQLLRKKIDEARAAALKVRLSEVTKLLEEQKPGPALDALVVAEKEGLVVAEPDRQEVATARAAAAKLLEARDVAWMPNGSFAAGEGVKGRQAFTAAVYVDRREVTNARWAKFVASGGGTPPAAWGGPTPPAGHEQRPVTGVSVRQAQAFAKWAGRRLPTVLEWERAARGDAGARFPWGDQADPGACVWNVPEPRDVGATPRDVSPFGCLDMGGNVAELALAPGSSEQHPAAWVKGGGFATRALACVRGAFWQEGLAADAGHPAVGFRCVADALPPEGRSP